MRTPTTTEMHHGRPAVEGDDPVPPEEVQQVRVVGVPEERLGVGSDQVGIEVGGHGDLVVAADDGEYRLDVRVGEGGVEIAGAVRRRGAQDPGRRVLHRQQAQLVAQPTESLLMQSREDLGESG